MMQPIFDVMFRLLPERYSHHRPEGERIVRFLIIGGLSFLFNYALYAFVSRVLAPNGNRVWQNFVTTAITCVLNYLGHRAWTFRSQGAHSTQATRYVMVAMSGIALQSGLFWIGHRWLGIHDLIVIFIVAILIPFYTYLAHKLFTFRSDHRECNVGQ